MHEQVIAHMRGRAKQLRKVLNLAHDQRMRDMIQKVIDEIEADVARLEAEDGGKRSK
jgi:hypothetical protein